MRGINTVMTPPAVSKPKLRGETSRRTMSLVLLVVIFPDKTEAIKYWYLYLIKFKIINGEEVNKMLTISKHILHNEFTRKEFDELSRDNEKLNELLKNSGINNHIIFMNYIHAIECGGNTTKINNLKKIYENSVKHPFYNDLTNSLTGIDEKNCKYKDEIAYEIAYNKLCKNIIYSNIKNVDKLIIGKFIARFINSLIDEINKNNLKNNVPSVRIDKLCNRIKIKQVIKQVIEGKNVIVFSSNEINNKQPLRFSPRNLLNKPVRAMSV